MRDLYLALLIVALPVLGLGLRALLLSRRKPNGPVVRALRLGLLVLAGCAWYALFVRWTKEGEREAQAVRVASGEHAAWVARRKAAAREEEAPSAPAPAGQAVLPGAPAKLPEHMPQPGELLDVRDSALARARREREESEGSPPASGNPDTIVAGSGKLALAESQLRAALREAWKTSSALADAEQVEQLAEKDVALRTRQAQAAGSHAIPGRPGAAEAQKRLDVAKTELAAARQALDEAKELQLKSRAAVQVCRANLMGLGGNPDRVARGDWGGHAAAEGRPEPFSTFVLKDGRSFRAAKALDFGEMWSLMDEKGAALAVPKSELERIEKPGAGHSTE